MRYTFFNRVSINLLSFRYFSNFNLFLKSINSFFFSHPLFASKVFSYWITVNYLFSYNIFSFIGILFYHYSPVASKPSSLFIFLSPFPPSNSFFYNNSYLEICMLNSTGLCPGMSRPCISCFSSINLISISSLFFFLILFNISFISLSLSYIFFFIYFSFSSFFSISSLYFFFFFSSHPANRSLSFYLSFSFRLSISFSFLISLPSLSIFTFFSREITPVQIAGVKMWGATFDEELVPHAPGFSSLPR